MTNPVQVQNVRFLLIYVDDLERSKKYYETYFGFEQTDEFGPGQIYGKIGALEMWLGAGYAPSADGEKGCRVTAMIGVDSAGKLFDNLQADNQKVIQDAPVEMQPGVFWLQCVDPAGNIIDVLGGA